MKNLVSEIRSIIETSRSNAVRSVDFCRVQMYWQIGRRIVEEEQGGQARAEYGKSLIKNLAKELEPEFGSGFGKRQLDYSKKFYLEFPIVHTLSAQLNWSQYKWLLDIADKDKREYYILETINNCWTARRSEQHRCGKHAGKRSCVESLVLPQMAPSFHGIADSSCGCVADASCNSFNRQQYADACRHRRRCRIRTSYRHTPIPPFYV